MRPDTLSVILRSASFIALFQAAGMAIFMVVFDRRLSASRAPLRRLVRLSVIAAIVFLIAQYALEAARMADELAGIFDPSLQRLAMRSDSGMVLTVRLAGLLFIAMTVGRSNRIGTPAGVIGSVIVVASFVLTGHTAANPLRSVLAALLAVHVAIVAFWFGALIPLYAVCLRESSATAGHVIEAFSRVAVWLVPGIMVAGLGLAFVLVRHLAEWRTDYGLSLMAKFSGFLLLMALASLNKWRLGPEVATGAAQASSWFRRSLGLEYLVIAAVLSVTATMTTLYSPEP